MLLSEYTVSKSVLKDIQKRALDVNKNNKIDISDISKILKVYTDNWL